MVIFIFITFFILVISFDSKLFTIELLIPTPFIKRPLNFLLKKKRFWTSGEMTQDGFINWNVQVINEAPNNMRWSKDSEFIVVSNPGVYKISVASFTTHPVKIEIFLNKLPGDYIHTYIHKNKNKNKRASLISFILVILSQTSEDLGSNISKRRYQPLKNIMLKICIMLYYTIFI